MLYIKVIYISIPFNNFTQLIVINVVFSHCRIVFEIDPYNRGTKLFIIQKLIFSSINFASSLSG